MAQGYTKRATAQEILDIHVRLLGTGASAPTLEEGNGVTVSRTGVGVYRLTFTENPFQFMSATNPALNSTTMSALKNYSVTFGDYTSSGGVYTLDLSVWNSAGAATDLAAAQRISFVLSFARTGY